MIGLAAGGVITAVLAAGLPLLVIASAADPADPACAESGQLSVAGSSSTTDLGSGAAGLGPAQLDHAAAIIRTGRARGIPEQGMVIALATALQESRLRVYANDGLGDDLAPEQEDIASSQDLPHEAVGTDYGSLGVFQQQWPWWGSMGDLMDPASSAGLFYDALDRVAGWEQLPVTVAAQQVQRSAYPDAYADDEPLARRLLADLTRDTTGSGGNIAAASVSCAPVLGAGRIAFPLPANSGYVDQENFGNTGSAWSSSHTGTDLSVACGTPVLAATTGTIAIDRTQPWAGPWLVKVSTGPGRLSTWYAHLSSVTVADGTSVSAGQQIGEVGDLGNATGCHLHFEVHPRGGSIYEDPINPTVWLQRHVGRRLDQPVGQPGGGVTPLASDTQGAGSYRVATFNVLGHSHTKPGGNKPGMAGSAPRMRAAVSLLNRWSVDVVALQEIEGIQNAMFRRMTSGWSLFRGSHAESVAWRNSAFALVRGWRVPIPYFHGRIRRMPVVALRDRGSGEVIIATSFHNPASVRRVGYQQHHRNEATRRQVALAERWGSRGYRIFIMGDMNERQEAFCRFTATGALESAAGGSHRGVCRPPGFDGIDHIFATPGTRFTGFSKHRDRRTRYASDHPIVLATVD